MKMSTAAYQNVRGDGRRHDMGTTCRVGAILTQPNDSNSHNRSETVSTGCVLVTYDDQVTLHSSPHVFRNLGCRSFRHFPILLVQFLE